MTTAAEQAHEYIGDPRGACDVCAFSVYHPNHDTPAEGKSNQCTQGHHGKCFDAACTCPHHLIRRLITDVPAERCRLTRTRLQNSLRGRCTRQQGHGGNHSFDDEPASEPQAAPPELKLCPFCDSNKVQSGSVLYPFYIYCSNCLAHGPHEGSENLGKKWNTRTSTAEALAEALREAKRIIKLNVGQISNQGWETFEQNSPVMRQINTALARWKGKGES